MRKHTNIKVIGGIRVATAPCALGAAFVINNNLADIVVYPAGTELKDLKNVMTLLGGSRDSGPFETIRDIRVDPSKSLSIAESSDEHPMHTDGTFDKNPPKLFLLQFVEVDEASGGVSTFLSVTSMLKKMPQLLRQGLESSRVSFGRADDSGRTDSHLGPVLYKRSTGGQGFRWRNDHQVSPVVVDSQADKVQEALGWIKGYIAASEPVQIQGRKGEIIIINNDRVLHGRTKLSGLASKRWVRRAWLAE